jgi:hypothetical protein
LFDVDLKVIAVRAVNRPLRARVSSDCKEKEESGASNRAFGSKILILNA